MLLMTRVHTGAGPWGRDILKGARCTVRSTAGRSMCERGCARAIRVDRYGPTQPRCGTVRCGSSGRFKSNTRLLELSFISTLPMHSHSNARSRRPVSDAHDVRKRPPSRGSTWLARPWLVGVLILAWLECPAAAAVSDWVTPINSFYSFRIIAQSTDSRYAGGFERQPSINESGQVAFVGRTAAASSTESLT